MKIKIITVGGRNPQWLDTGISQYLERINSNWQLQQVRVAQIRRSPSVTAAQCKIREGKNIARELNPSDYIILLDEHGELLSTSKWANKLNKVSSKGKVPVFIVGGSDGVSDDIKKQAHCIWGLSSLTMAHGLAQLVLAEQLYRVHSLNNNHPYHRA